MLLHVGAHSCGAGLTVTCEGRQGPPKGYQSRDLWRSRLEFGFLSAEPVKISNLRMSMGCRIYLGDYFFFVPIDVLPPSAPPSLL